jgi:hypothetical protein
VADCSRGQLRNREVVTVPSGQLRVSGLAEGGSEARDAGGGIAAGDVREERTRPGLGEPGDSLSLERRGLAMGEPLKGRDVDASRRRMGHRWNNPMWWRCNRRTTGKRVSVWVRVGQSYPT